MGTIGQFAEVASRHKVSGVLQRLLLLLRSARCCHPAAQWYISHLRRARHLLHKVLFGTEGFLSGFMKGLKDPKRGRHSRENPKLGSVASSKVDKRSYLIYL